MKKGTKILISCLAVVCLAVYNILFFYFVRVDNSIGVWVAYAAGDVVFCIAVVLPWFFKKKSVKNYTEIDKTAFIKEMSLKINALACSCPDEQIAKKLELLYVRIHTSQSASCSDADDIEQEIVNAVSEAELAANSGDWKAVEKYAAETDKLITGRNNLLRANNMNF